MKILFAASEGVPFCKTGGLADVVGALPLALAAKRHQVRLILPYYRQIRQGKFQTTAGPKLSIEFDGKPRPVQVRETDVRANFRVYFIDAPEFFDRSGIYGDQPGAIYDDNDERYAFFSKAVFEVAKKTSFSPDILHAHDWQTGLAMANLKLRYAKDRFFSKTSSIFTIHNMAYQGNYPAPAFHKTGLPPEAYSIQGVEFYGKVSFLKAGLVYADAVNTVSPTYAKEISSMPEFGCGMEGILRERSTDFTGILNGIDTEFWNPKTDSAIEQPFDKGSVDKRAENKTALQSLAGISTNPSVPLLGFIGRVDYQKGIDLLIEAIPPILKDGGQFVSLGQGNPQYTKDLKELERRYPAQVHVKTDFAEPFAHKIYAGVDIFLMPSRFEPCGLGQLIAMRYGAIPVVTPTGGLLDTVVDNASGQGTGYVAKQTAGGAFLAAVRNAVGAWDNFDSWSALQRRAMSKDFSWRSSIGEYLMLYESVAKSHV